MIKLKDIAERLNVSISTVSRVVNNQNRVDPETRKRILKALKELNYQPDENARRLKTNTSNVIGVIVPDISNPYYASVIKGIENVMAKNGCSVILCNTDESKERERIAIQMLLRQKVAGLVIATVLDESQVLNHYLHLDFPVVFFDNVPSVDEQINSVTINNMRATKEMVEYMIRRGHHRIFMIAGPVGESSASERLIGWKKALQEAGIDFGDDWYAHGDFREESGKLFMDGFLNRGNRPTAICIANNLMAYGATKSIYGAGLSIPEDISVGAFDIVDATGLMKLMFTTVIEPAEEIGMIAADMCLQDNTRDGLKISRKIILEHHFFENGTVKLLR